MCIKQREPAKNVLKKWKSIIDFFVSPNVVLHDGNGRTGRMILFRESLKYDELVPFIILDDDRSKYLEGLKEFREHHKVDQLLELMQKEAETYYQECQYFIS